MPTYDYECRKCGNQTEVFHGMLEKPRVKCPKCKGGMRKLIGTGAGIIFKGSGFYETDYRSEAYKSKAKADSAKPSGSDSSTGDGKAATKSETKAKSKPKSKAGNGKQTKSTGSTGAD